MSVEIGREEALDAVRSVTLPYTPSALSGLYAVLLHAAKDDKTSVIATVRVDARTFVATDRMTVGRWTHSAQNAPTDDSPTILVPRLAAEWLTKQLPKTLGMTETHLTGQIAEHTSTTIAFASESISVISDAGDVLATTRFEPVTGNFPPVEKLFEKIECATDAHPIALATKHLDKFSKGAVRVAKRDASLTMTPTVGSTGKPGPVLVTFGEHFDGLVQPESTTGVSR